jgi:hypothetical protein
VCSFISNALAYTFFFIIYKYNLLQDFDNTNSNNISGFLLKNNNNNNNTINDTNNSTVNNNSELYSIFVNKYKIYIYEKYNFSLEIINEHQFNEIVEIFNLGNISININDTNNKNNINNTNNTNYLDLIINFLITKKEYKHICKNSKKNTINEMMELLFNNEHFIPNTVLNLFSGNGGFSDWLLTYKQNIHHNNIYSYDTYESVNNINKLNKLVSFNKDLDTNIIKGDVIHDNLFNNKYDLIVCDIPDNIKNIIHAECCTLIKQLKIRGTKSEPLIIQLLSQLVSKSGYIICNVSNSFLFSDSIQHVQTRKYIIENFNNIQVITKNDDTKKSILLLHANAGNLNKEHIIKLNSKLIQPNTFYSLYYTHYENPTNNKQIINKVKLSEIIKITNNTNDQEYLYINSQEYLYINKFNCLNIDLLSKTIKIDSIIVSKDTTKFSQEFVNIYIKSIIEKNFNIITKGKMKQIDEELLCNIEVEYPTIEFQKIFLSHYKFTIDAIELNNNKVNNLENLKKYRIQTNICEENEKLSNICLIDNKSNKSEKSLYIHKNSNNAGTIGFTFEPVNTNYYYIHMNNTNYEEQYIYNILKFNEELLVKYSNENQTVGLAKNKLENLSIPKLPKDSQLHLNGLIEQIDIQINKYKSDIKFLKDKQFVN